ncbi:hypothetical protein ACIQVT_00020 [Streptomyces sp. NPDC100445]|uniref:hypothetical protein n=1 Tax=Streptomyces sp. NPDC100445 TaxID=3366102 RepID=UPI003821A92E
MMHAWSPHTFEAPEAQAAGEALASVLSPQERQQVRAVIDGIETDDDEARAMDLAKGQHAGRYQ